jgi:hypothetical protein
MHLPLASASVPRLRVGLLWGSPTEAEDRSAHVPMPGIDPTVSFFLVLFRDRAEYQGIRPFLSDRRNGRRCGLLLQFANRKPWRISALARLSFDFHDG